STGRDAGPLSAVKISTTSFGFGPNDASRTTVIPGYNGLALLVMSLAGMSGRYSLAVQGGSTIWPIFTNCASIDAGTCARTWIGIAALIAIANMALEKKIPRSEFTYAPSTLILHPHPPALSISARAFG